MGECIYCGKSTRWFVNKHSECEAKYELGKYELINIVQKAMQQRTALAQLEVEAKKIATDHYIKEGDLQALLFEGWEAASTNALEDGLLTSEEEDFLARFMTHFKFSKFDLDQSSVVTQLIHASILREVLQGNIVDRRAEGPQVFNLLKSESLVWSCSNVEYLESKTSKRYVGGSQGVSVRLFKGVYYRVGGFQGRKIETSQIVPVDQGILGVTTKHIYYVGKAKRFRIAYQDIISFEPFKDALGLQRDNMRTGPQYFMVDDGWFAYNLVCNLSQL